MGKHRSALILECTMTIKVVAHLVVSVILQSNVQSHAVGYKPCTENMPKAHKIYFAMH